MWLNVKKKGVNKMRKFESTIKFGTLVYLVTGGWAVVKAVHETRNWVQLEGYNGSFQRCDILKYTNK